MDVMLIRWASVAQSLLASLMTRRFFRNCVSLIVAATWLAVAQVALAAEVPARTLAMMAPAERDAMIDAMRQEVDAMLAVHIVDGYPWPIVAELSMDEAANEIVVDFDGRLTDYEVPDDTGVCQYVRNEVITVLELMDATAGLNCLFGGQEQEF